MFQGSEGQPKPEAWTPGSAETCDRSFRCFGFIVHRQVETIGKSPAENLVMV